MIKIQNKTISRHSPAFIIAEAGVNHNGSIENCFKLIDAAVWAGANAVKFQTFITENLVIPEALKASYQIETTGVNETQYDMLKKVELTFGYHLQIVEYCKKKGIIFLSTPFDSESVDLLEKLEILAYKVSSADITNLPLLNYISTKNKPVLLSTGMSTLGEIEEALSVIRKHDNNEVVLLHCTSNYPTEYADANLKAIQTLGIAFGLPIGYSDHTMGIEASLAAVALGAKVIEKHFTLDRKLPGPDHKASLEPDEFRLMVNSIRNIEMAMGDGIKRCMLSEENVKSAARKSIVIAKNIPEGTILKEDMLAIKRPGTGLSPKLLPYLIGRKTRIFLKKDAILRLSDLV